MVERLTIFLMLTAVLAGGVLVWLWNGGGAADPLAAQLQTVGAAMVVPGPTAPVRILAADGVLAEGTWSIGADRLRVRVTSDLSAAESTALATEEKALILNLFEDHQVPYPGALSNTLQCPDALHPVDIEPRGSALFLLGLYANDRYAFGGCAEDLVQFRATVAAYYDLAHRALVRLEYFEPKAGEAAPHGPDALRSFYWTPG